VYSPERTVKNEKRLSTSMSLSGAGAGLALLLFIASDALATDIPAIVKIAEPAVVELFCYDQAGELIKSGTGFLISSDGVLLTNYHLLQGGTYRISAKTLTDKLYTGMCILAAPDGEHYPHQADVAELQFTDVKEVPYLSLSSAESLEGESVLVVGNPEGYTGTVSTDIISAVRNRQTVVQITAPISPGSSGSPLLDECENKSIPGGG
jgi:serine protease Do